MFKKQKKTTVEFSHQTDGSSIQTTSIPLNEGKLIEHLKDIIGRYGEIVIRHISKDNKMDVTTSRTMEYEKREDRLEALNEVIRDYIKGNAVSMEAYAVFANGVLKGIFGNKGSANLKRKSLINKGFTKDSVRIQPIEVNSFQDFQLNNLGS